MFESNEIKIETAEDAKRVLSELASEQKRLKDANRALTENLDAKVADLKAAQKTLTEAQNRANDRGEGSAVIRDFVHKRHDGAEVIRWKSGANDEGDFVPGLLDTPTDDAWVSKMQNLIEQRTLVRTMTKGRSHKAAPGNSPKTDRAIERHLQRAPEPVRRLFSDASGTGAEFIPDLLSPQLEQGLRMARRVEAIFPEWQMEGKEVQIPFLSTELRPYKKVAITSDDPAQYTSSTIVTAQRSITATGLAVRAQLDEDTTEDSIIQGLPLHRALLVQALTDGCEDCIINGDTAATHQDTGLSNWDIRGRWGSSGLGGSADHRRTWLGLRAAAADASSTVDGSTAETLAGLLSDRASLDSPHGVAGDLVMIVSPEYYLAKMLDWDEVLTMDKFPNPTVVTGALANVAGMPVVISEFIDKEYNTAGIYDNSTKTKTGYLLVNRGRWYMGVRRSALVEVDKDITRGVIDAVSTVRKVFFTVDASTKKNVMWSYNHSVS